MYYHLTYLFIYMAFLLCLTKIVMEVVDSSYHGQIFRNLIRHDSEHNSTLDGNYSYSYQSQNNYSYYDEPDDHYISTSFVSALGSIVLNC